jgi:hypothetical protein
VILSVARKKALVFPKMTGQRGKWLVFPKMSRVAGVSRAGESDRRRATSERAAGAQTALGGSVNSRVFNERAHQGTIEVSRLRGGFQQEFLAAHGRGGDKERGTTRPMAGEGGAGSGEPRTTSELKTAE